ncbi:uncharacterized protein LOC111618057 [Centruroides sculpturatus]|uniref:uncharacterized protein LOC111618057 n=1 Tax=Centruroides sculpturatus TaxID=218467 RepID=UPI000C6EE96E|nr:uncharacterized protein LOC111618057 [Centruroides sculpturatus]
MCRLCLLFFSALFPICSSLCNAIAPPYYGLDRPALEYELPPLPYLFHELEPFLDEETVRIHYLGHHSKYTENMNMVLKEWRRNAQGKQTSRISIIDILRNLSRVPSRYQITLKNNGGGYVNHAFYWAVMSPNSQNEDRMPQGQLAEDIKAKFRSFLEFRDTFTDMAEKLFGSGYVWLCRNHSHFENPQDLVIVTTANQDCPLSNGLWPILVLDVWEHSYYLKYHNQRSKYIHDWWYLVDWQNVLKLDDWWKGLKLHDEL